jgi:chemotaxis protein CheD
VDGKSLKKGNIIFVPVGEFKVSSDPDKTLTTCLGSCIGLALYDHSKKIAGILHILLPEYSRGLNMNTPRSFYADTGISMLIEAMEEKGALCENMTATLAGGACLTSQGNPEIGLKNTRETLAALTEKGIAIKSQKTGGDQRYTITVNVGTGNTLIKLPGSFNHIDAPSPPTDQTLPGHLVKTRIKSLQKLRCDRVVSEQLFKAINEKTIRWEHVEKLVHKDIVLAMHIYQMFNSEYYGLPHGINCFKTALILLGAKKLRRICVAAASKRNNENLLNDFGMDQKLFSQHCLCTAVIAEYLCVRLNHENKNDIFMASLFHHCGYIATLAWEQDEIKDPMDTQSDTNHLSCNIMMMWQFPYEISQASKDVGSPRFGLENPSMSTLIHIACNLSSLLLVKNKSCPDRNNIHFSAEIKDLLRSIDKDRSIDEDSSIDKGNSIFDDLKQLLKHETILKTTDKEI